ncbi:MAG: GNAT family N-acetyltransferase [Smithellaceae bacterium]
MIVKIRYLIRNLKSDGVYNTLRTLLTNYLIVNHFIVFHKNLGTRTNYSMNAPLIEMRKISIEELLEIREKETRLPIQFYCDLTHQFTHAFVAFAENRIAAIHWLVLPGQYSRFFDLTEGDAELNYNTVLPQFRGSGIARGLMSFVTKYCEVSGLNDIFGVVNVKNIPQYKQMIRLGFEPVEILTHFGPFRPKASLVHCKTDKRHGF